MAGFTWADVFRVAKIGWPMGAWAGAPGQKT